jgi:hypothetical protein
MKSLSNLGALLLFAVTGTSQAKYLRIRHSDSPTGCHCESALIAVLANIYAISRYWFDMTDNIRFLHDYETQNHPLPHARFERCARWLRDHKGRGLMNCAM